ncbi:unnamed protein product [Polarella glacialis]|uniref:Uncharacterized protein n=1 Tax=Polarella glacialis TaxID=89957 RepID=A0A813DKJ4_POLGL|nr:unnamed protein product [Polarella glacialis]CAE8643486.1 unnamed protein product [Polarella glacialis]|mmetsp:Transcript_20476/g.32656  ORF Transcript_20476/g.32656 Transcript_20476/m.32656 type:complete len:278 (-) Transcript_20476:187-1020(-)
MASELLEKLSKRMSIIESTEGSTMENSPTPQKWSIFGDEYSIPECKENSASAIRRPRKSIGSDFLTTIAERRAAVDGNAKTFENSPLIKASDFASGDLPPSPVRGRRSLGTMTPSPGRTSLTARTDSSWIGVAEPLPSHEATECTKASQPMPAVKANRTTWSANLGGQALSTGLVLDSPKFQVDGFPEPVFFRLSFSSLEAGGPASRCALSLQGPCPDGEVRIVFFVGDKWQDSGKERPSVWHQDEAPSAEFAVSDMVKTTCTLFCGFIYHRPHASA